MDLSFNETCRGDDPEVWSAEKVAVIYPGTCVGVGYGTCPDVAVTAPVSVPIPPVWLLEARSVTVYVPGVV